MTLHAALQILITFAVVLLLTKPLGAYMARVFGGEQTFLRPVLGPVERLFYRLCGVDPAAEMRWMEYAKALLAFSAVGIALSYVLLRAQGELAPDAAFNASVSFVTNTGWQDYAPETKLSPFSRMVTLGVHQWTSAAAGIAVGLALMRGFARGSATVLGNFWVDATRATLYVLLPLALVAGVAFAAAGVPQTFTPHAEVAGVEAGGQIPLGPVASHEAIKHLGTTGAGFFDANSAHPFENPGPFTNFLSMVLSLLIPASLTYTFGRMVGTARQGWAIFAAMGSLLLVGAFASVAAEGAGGADLEGKETRFGASPSAIFATVATGAGSAATNAVHGSFTPLGSLVPTLNILSGGVAFGSVGTGLAGILVFAILAVFLAGLMVGRTPEFLGKRIERGEMRMAMLALLMPVAAVLLSTALTSLLVIGKGGPHGFTEILYTHAGAATNSGSRFEGGLGPTPYYNASLGIAMLVGRFGAIIPILALAGSLAAKKQVPSSEGALPTDGGTFTVLLVMIVLVFIMLTYFPALALGPIAEALGAKAPGGR